MPETKPERGLSQRFFRDTITNWLLAIIAVLNLLIVVKPFAKGKAICFANDMVSIQRSPEGISFIQTISFKNEGNKPITITRIQGYVRAKDIDFPFARELKKISLLDRGHDLAFMQFSISPDQEFIYDVKLAKEPDRIVRDSNKIFHSLIVDEYQTQSLPPNVYAQGYKASKKLSASIDKWMRNRTNDLKSGEYEYILEIYSGNSKKPVFSSCYSLFISPENIFLLNEGIKDYKIYYPQYVGAHPWAEAPLTRINNEKIISSLEKLLHN